MHNSRISTILTIFHSICAFIEFVFVLLLYPAKFETSVFLQWLCLVFYLLANINILTRLNQRLMCSIEPTTPPIHSPIFVCACFFMLVGTAIHLAIFNTIWQANTFLKVLFFAQLAMTSLYICCTFALSIQWIYKTCTNKNVNQIEPNPANAV